MYLSDLLSALNKNESIEQTRNSRHFSKAEAPNAEPAHRLVSKKGPDQREAVLT